MKKSFSEDDFNSLDGSYMSYDSIGSDMSEIENEAIRRDIEKKRCCGILGLCSSR